MRELSGLRKLTTRPPRLADGFGWIDVTGHGSGAGQIGRPVVVVNRGVDGRERRRRRSLCGP